ncbi:HAD family phosphatase [bacterium]|nr:HAD family phosphatase [bacterium]
MEVKGIIFDFNGTLFEDSKLHEQAWRDYSAKLRGTPFSDEEMHKYMFGRSNEEIITYAIGRKPTHEECLKWANEKEAYYRDLVLKNPEIIHLTEGAEEFFDYICEKNIPHTIATGSEKTNVDFFVETFNLKKWFDVDKIVYDDYTIPGKPNPAIYLKALDILGLKAENTLVFEDSFSGITAANNAKIGKIIAINANPDDFQHKDKVYKVIKNFNEINEDILFAN